MILSEMKSLACLISLAISLPAACGLRLVPIPRHRAPCMAAVDDLNSIADAWLEGEEIESRIKQATDKVAAAQAAAKAAAAAQEAAEQAIAGAVAKVEAAEAEVAVAQKAADAQARAARLAQEDAKVAARRAETSQSSIEGTKVEKKKVSNADPLLSALFGEGKSARKARENAEAQKEQAARASSDAAVAARAAADERRAAQLAAERVSVPEAAAQAAREAQAAKEEAAREAAEATRAALEAVEAAKVEQEAVSSAHAEWGKENPTAAGSKAAVEIGAKGIEMAATAGLTLLFGESRSAKEERLRKEQEQADAERTVAEKEAAERAAEEAKIEAAAAAVRAAEEAAAAEAAAKEAARVAAANAEAAEKDAELRRKREEAQATLKNRRPKKLSESFSLGVADAALAAAAAAAETAAAKDKSGVGGIGKSMASWAAGRRDSLREESDAREKYDRLILFESDLDLLGITLEQAVELDEKGLRKAFRDRSRELHPDAQVGEDKAGIPSVYELNAAYDAIRKLL